MPHFMIVLHVMPYVNLLNLSWIIKCLFLRNMETLKRQSQLHKIVFKYVTDESFEMPSYFFQKGINNINFSMSSALPHSWQIKQMTH